MADGVEQAEGCQHRQGQGKHNLQQHADIRASVHGRGLFQLLGNALEEVLDDHHVIGADGAGQQDGPVGVGKIQDIRDDDISGNHAAGEEHGDDDHVEEEVPAPQAGLGQGVGHGHRAEQVYGRTADRDENRIREAAKDLVRGEDELIGGGGNVLGNEEHGPGGDFVLGGKGSADDIHERKDRGDGHQGQEDIIEDIKDAASHGTALADRTGGDLQFPVRGRNRFIHLFSPP